PAFDEADISDKPPYVSERERFNPRELQRLERQNRLRIQSLQSVDDLVANVARTLDQTGRLDNTVIAFTSDNGFIQGQHRIFNGKIVPYSSSTQVPLLVRGPGFERGTRSDALVANVDLAPTFLELARAKPLVEPDGVSLVPLLEGKRLPPRELVLEDLESNAPGEEEGGGSYAPYRALRTERWLYVVYDDPHQGVELYNLRKDPDNLENLAYDTHYTRVRQRLNRRLQALKDCAGDACR
ncbi:MAG: sulfatase/phosphatase domain-containing protein, partial [Solirubrobacterales bacterium]